MTPILEARGLTKRFGRTQALAGLDLVVQPGRVVALLGPNGAGKTTFILWDAIRRLVAAGTDILLTTQYLAEADRLAADIVIIDRGAVIAAGTPAELKALAGDDVIEAHVRDETALSKVAAALATVGHDPRTDPATHRVSVTVDGGTNRLVEAARAIDHIGVPVEDISLRRPTLDEVFLTLTREAS